jgi:cytochrome c
MTARNLTGLLALVAGVVGLTGTAFAEGDAAAGQKVFNQCAVCHSPEPETNKVGPSLFGVVGRASATVGGYSYSAAMKAANKTWDEATLDAYLTDPRAAVPGTKMIFAGVKDATQRQNVIAYLATLK